jgi:mono/diheme cytochrome c family protein
MTTSPDKRRILFLGEKPSMTKKLIAKSISIAAWTIIVSSLAACGSAAPTAEPARPSNPGGPGEAVNLTGNASAGQQVFQTNCVECHGDQGKGGVSNPGSDDGTVPTLNPIDPTLVSSNAKTFATNLDLFLQHGSTPEGSGPEKSMPAWGDDNKLTQQQIADVIAYVISLNKP